MSSQKEKFLASAQKFIQKGQFDRALRDYEQVVTADPKDVKHRQKLAELLVRCNRKDEAVREYETIARYYDENGFFLKSIAVYKQIQRLDPTNIEISLSLAALNEKQGMIGNALSEYKVVYDYHKNAGRYDDAAKILEKMQLVDPENVDIRLTLAETLFAAGAVERSYQEFTRAALALRNRGDMTTFHRVGKRIQELFPDRADSGLDLLEEQLRNGAVGEALPRLEQLYREDSGNERVAALLVEAYRISGNHAARKELLGRILEARPDDMAAIKGLIEATVASEDLEGSLDLLSRYLPRLYDAGAYGEVESYYTTLLNRDPYDLRLLEGLKKQYELTGESTKLADIQVSLNIISQKAAGEAAPTTETTAAAVPGAAVDHSGAGPADFTWGDELDLSGLAGISPDETGETLEQEQQIFGEIPLEVEAEQAAEVPDDTFELEISFELPQGEDLFAPPKSTTAEGAPSPETGLGDESPAEGLPIAAGAPAPEKLTETEEMPLIEAELVLEEETGLGLPLELEDLERTVSDGEDAGGGLEFLEEITLEYDESDELEKPSEEVFATAPEPVPSPLPEEIPGESVPTPEEDIPLPEEPSVPSAGSFLTSPAGEFGASTDKYAFDGMFSRFKESLDQQVDSGDTETHYNLGIAYMEMGLYDDAIKEFTIAGNDASRHLDCLTLQGVCCREKGDFEEAEKIISSGLSIEGLDRDRILSLRYELALAQEMAGRRDEALQNYREIFVVNPAFRDTMKKIARLSGKESSFDLSELDDVDFDLK